MTKKETAKPKQKPFNDELYNSLMLQNKLLSERIKAIERNRAYECDLKNQCYFFILQNGLLDKFREYSKSHPVAKI
ncbi:hypothetical protein [Bergeyella zoohelcum]|uniref:Uncharacterized protein n=1 Tax=Bergeyella zoohelcum TaxID=1015 RepID=A0A7Z8YLB2_9FLAO|nr:hypothetical protein [Bergeyella zoohelcum]VDH02558.1 Uncharacterised protein [Bergeyella zoohelcum]